MKKSIVVIAALIMITADAFAGWNSNGHWVVESGDNPYDIVVRQFQVDEGDVSPVFFNNVIHPKEEYHLFSVIDTGRPEVIKKYVKNEIRIADKYVVGEVYDATPEPLEKLIWAWAVYDEDSVIGQISVSACGIDVNVFDGRRHYFTSVKNANDFWQEYDRAKDISEQQVEQVASVEVVDTKFESIEDDKPVEIVDIKSTVIDPIAVSFIYNDSRAWDFGFKASSRNMYYDRGRDGKERNYVEVKAWPELKWTFGVSRIFIKGEFVYDSDGASDGMGGSFVEGNDAQEASFREAYFLSVFGGFVVAAGKKTVNWSKVEFSPSDIAPYDWSAGYMRERRPLVGLEVESDVMKFFVSPFSTPPLLPASASRWSKDLPAGVTLAEVDYDERQPLAAVSFPFRIMETDIGIGLRHGYTGRLDYELGVDNGQLAIKPIMEKAYTFSFSAVKDWFVLTRLEAGLFFADNDRQYLRYVLGVEYEWSYLFGLDRIFTITEYMREEEIAEEAEDYLEVIDFSSLYDNNLMMRLEISPREDWRFHFLCEAMYSFKGEDGMVLPRIVYRGSYVEAELGYLVLYGKRDYFWRCLGYDRNNALYFKINITPF